MCWGEAADVEPGHGADIADIGIADVEAAGDP
jgi:hypothetical protein